MIRRFREAGLSEPVFALEDGFRISLGRPAASGPGQEPTQEPRNTTQEAKEETAEETQVETKKETEAEAPRSGVSAATSGKATARRSQILEQLRANPEITIAELARLMHLSDSGVEYNLRKLRQEGRICREGSTKAGRWVVLDSSPGGVP
jgi:predicted HTH transcriptional regulator